jgi:hypothetical protein
MDMDFLALRLKSRVRKFSFRSPNGWSGSVAHWLRMRKMLTPDSVRASASLEAVASEPVYSSPDSCLVILLIELLETVKFTPSNRAGGRVGRD